MTLGVRKAAAMCEIPVSFATTRRARATSAAAPPSDVRPARSSAGARIACLTDSVMPASARVPVSTTCRPSSARASATRAKRSGSQRRDGSCEPGCTTA